MGKPYSSEIAALPKTITWALSAEISALASFICEAHGTPLIATGSGGSLSAAKLASVFHQTLGAGFSKSATPLELASLESIDTNASFLLFSAGGANRDVRMVFERLALKEPRRFMTVTGRIATPIARLAKRYPCCQCIELDVPSGKDGFLATNSLIAFSILIARAYASAQNISSTFPSLQNLVSDRNCWNKHTASLDAMTITLWKQRHLVVLYSPDLEAAAIDIESKFTEAALGTVQIADYRHFAHGRHHWLAKQGEHCAVLAFFTPRFQQLADKTLRCLPKSISVVQMPFPEDKFDAGVSAMLTSILLAGFAGRECGIDPGRPGVPEFGRKIYHLSWKPAVSHATKHPRDQVAIYRKLRASANQTDTKSDSFSLWAKAHQVFCRRLIKQPLKGIVLDYDGTMVFTNHRFGPVPSNVAAPLASFLRNGLVVGVASGRGKSLRETLQKTFPREFWSQVVVGYYNGSQTGLLDDDSLPKLLPVEDELSAIHQKLSSLEALLGRVKMEARHNQLSITSHNGLHVEELWNIVAEFLSSKTSSMRVICSGHSVDIIARNTSKRAVVEHVSKLANAKENEVLCIGDKGRWPGNDSELLVEFPSLSVDDVSTESGTCWNLAPVGCIGPNALATYLSSIKLAKCGMIIDPAKIRSVR